MTGIGMPNLVGWLLPRHRSAAKATAAFEAAKGHAGSSQDTAEFLAVEWLLPNDSDATAALRQFEEDSLHADDLDDRTYQRVRSCLSRWARDQHRVAA